MASKQKVLTKAGVERIILDHLQQWFPLHRGTQKKDQGIGKLIEADSNEINYKHTHDELNRQPE